MGEIITVDKDKLMEIRDEVPYLVDQFMDAYYRLKNWLDEDERRLIDRVEYTDHGFEIIKFKDFYSKECLLQQSSLAYINAIWLGNDSYDRMHLDDGLVEQLIEVLQQWLKTGSFKKEK